MTQVATKLRSQDLEAMELIFIPTTCHAYSELVGCLDMYSCAKLSLLPPEESSRPHRSDISS